MIIAKAQYGLLAACALVLVVITTSAQDRAARPDEIPPQFRPPHPAAKMQERYFVIDQKRHNDDMYTEDALPRSREFKRIDSTYYVGWMFEGVYKYNHAADYFGFRNAAIPLAKALDLLEHDYARALRTRTSDVMVYYPIYKIQIDYTMIAYMLMNCYSNTDEAEKAYALLRRVIRWNLQRQYYMDSYDYLAWITHRNRFYTRKEFGFLRNSIDSNEALAGRYLDTAIMVIARNQLLHDKLEPGRLEEEKYGVYHYRNILYSYTFQIDSAFHYFDLMRKHGRLPHNNFATFNAVCGNFQIAEDEYRIASEQDAGDKRLQEWAYYTSILDIYKGQPKAGAQLSRDMIKANGTTPGYGWYNIGLARSLLYDGQVGDAVKYTVRAGEFREMHIGTTLGQSHYEFSVQLLQLIEREREIEMLRFENRNWWYNPVVLLKMGVAIVQKMMQQYLIINQFSNNPERDRVIYKLFSNESTVSWDEVWYLVHDFSTKFFIKKFEREAATDKRERIRKYFSYFVATLKMKQGKYREARLMLNELTRDASIDTAYEKLFVARLYEAEANCAKHLDEKAEYHTWMNKLYGQYPQLVPFSGEPMAMNMVISGSYDKGVVKRLKACNIDTQPKGSAPTAYITFRGSGDKRSISYYVRDASGNDVVTRQSFGWKNAEDAGTQLAYRLFGIGGGGGDL